MTDTASASDPVFGLCQLLGLCYSPRLADLPSWRLFRLSASADYGALGPLSRRVIDNAPIREHCEDMCRAAGTLHTQSRRRLRGHSGPPARRSPDHAGRSVG